MEKVRPRCGQPSDRGRLKTEQNREAQRSTDSDVAFGFRSSSLKDKNFSPWSRPRPSGSSPLSWP